jgi:hypothetical protein
VKDITIEEPTEHFTALRDFVDCKLLKKYGIFQEKEFSTKISEGALHAAQEKLRIPLVQKKSLTSNETFFSLLVSNQEMF